MKELKNMKSLEHRYIDKLKKERDPTYALQKAYSNYKSSIDNAKYRLYKRVYKMIERGAYFITLTYDNDNLPKKESYAVRHMRDYCKNNLDHYLGNIDYGSINDRIHIHIIGNVKKDVLLSKSWNKGNIDFKKVSYNKWNARKLTLYVTKISNHSVKDGTKHLYRSKKI